jgi:hypothetical protein
MRTGILLWVLVLSLFYAVDVVYAQDTSTQAVAGPCDTGDIAGCKKQLYDYQIAAYQQYMDALSKSANPATDPAITKAYQDYVTAQNNYCQYRLKLGEVTTCDTQGTKTTPQTDYKFSITPSSANVVANGADKITFVYTLESTVSGTSTPLSGETVGVELQYITADIESGGTIDSGSGESTWNTNGVTDSAGTVTISYTAPKITKPDFTGGSVTLAVTHAKGTAKAAITVSPAAGITGQVVDYIDYPISGVPIDAYTDNTCTVSGVSATTDQNGKFILNTDPSKVYCLHIGTRWQKDDDKVDLKIKDVKPNDNLGKIVYATVEDHYVRNADNIKTLLDWYDSDIVKAGVRGFAWNWTEMGYRNDVHYGTHPSTVGVPRQSDGSSMPDRRIVDWFYSHGKGRIGRCSDVNSYIFDEYKQRFGNDPKMKELTLMTIGVDNTAPTLLGGEKWGDHESPIIIPSVIKISATEWRPFLENHKISLPVRINADILDAYDSDRTRAVKSYDRWTSTYMRAWGTLTLD